jgi:MFS family permease
VVENPWLVLTVEFLKAFTFSVVWAAALSFICDSCQNGSTLAAFVHMLFWGVGYGGGGIIGGVLMERIGGRTTFLGLAVISLSVVMLIFVVIQLDCYQRRLQDIDKPVESDDSDE